MLTDNLVSQITFSALCTVVPVHHAALHIQHIDGVIAHAFHQQTEVLLLLVLFTQQRLLFGAVAGDFGVANQLAGIITNRVNDDMCPKCAAIFAVPVAFVFETTGFEGGGEIFFRDMVFTILGAVEA